MDHYFATRIFLFVFCFHGIVADRGKLPNIILILTDDQDVILNGLHPMRNVINLLGTEGAIFENAFTTSPMCCPSRASLLSGQYVHNHRTWNNSVAGGCNGQYWLNQIEENTLAPTLLKAGYTNFFAGKYLNGFQAKHWLISNAQVIPNNTLELMDIYFKKRWQSLLAVDELVADVISNLKNKGQLDNTYIIYTSDNGYHIGQFAQPFDKRQPYETDIRVPLLIRGPNIPKGVKITAPTALIDIFPTILEWLNLPSNRLMDGQSINAFIANAPDYDASLDRSYRRSILVQHFGEGNLQTYKPECPWSRMDRLAECTKEADCHCQDAWNNTYSCVRHFGYKSNRLYCEFKDNEDFVEAYEIDQDPYQMENMIRDMLPSERAIYSLALQNLTKCVGSSACNDVIL
ncbi:N-acetylglucosamine-6-sulfatase-like isoform 2-T2 [Cochliomyia hominivorax]